MNKLKLLIPILFLFSFGVSKAQDYTLENVGRNALRNSGSIVENGVITGYYFFYYSEKVSRKESRYEIVILDADLNEKASESIVESKATYLLEASYNGDVILFKFYDSKNREVSYRSINKDGKLSKKESREANKYEIGGYTTAMNNGSQSVNMNRVSDEYFVDVYTYKDKKVTYTVNCLNNTGRSVWEYTPTVKKGVKQGSFLASNEDNILILESSSKSIMSRDYSFEVINLDASGEEKYRVPMATSRYTLLPYNAVIGDDGMITIMGEYFDIKDKALKAESKGIFVTKLDENGAEVDANYISWSKDLKSAVAAEYRKDIGKYSLIFHDVQLTKSGKIIAVTEQYRKQLSAGGTALKLAAAAMNGVSTNASSLEIKIADLLVITIDENLELESAEVLEKKPSKIVLAQDYSLVSRHVLAKMLQAQGAFDYAFSQVNADRTLVSIGYFDVDKKDGKIGREVVFKMANYTDGEEELVIDQVDLSTDASAIYVIPAKSGNVLLAEYFRKEKTMEVHLEPLNF